MVYRTVGAEPPRHSRVARTPTATNKKNVPLTASRRTRTPHRQVWCHDASRGDRHGQADRQARAALRRGETPICSQEGGLVSCTSLLALLAHPLHLCATQPPPVNATHERGEPLWHRRCPQPSVGGQASPARRARRGRRAAPPSTHHTPPHRHRLGGHGPRATPPQRAGGGGLCAGHPTVRHPPHVAALWRQRAAGRAGQLVTACRGACGARPQEGRGGGRHSAPRPHPPRLVQGRVARTVRSGAVLYWTGPPAVGDLSAW